MLYDLSKPYDKQRFEAKLSRIKANGGIVELTEKKQRTANQNRYLHLLIGVVAMDTGNTIEYTKETYYKKLVNSSIFVVEKIDPYLGKVEILRSTRTLTKEEMSASIDKFKRWGESEGFAMPDITDSATLAEIEMQMSRMINFI